MSDSYDQVRSPAFAQRARSPDHSQAFTRTRKLPLPTLTAALLSFRGGSLQSELDAFLHNLGARGAATLVSDRALAKARSKLHVPALWALNDRLIDAVAAHGHLHLFKVRRLVCADGTLFAPAQSTCLRTRCLAEPHQRALGLYLPGNELKLHLTVGTRPRASGRCCLTSSIGCAGAMYWSWTGVTRPPGWCRRWRCGASTSSCIATAASVGALCAPSKTAAEGGHDQRG